MMESFLRSSVVMACLLSRHTPGSHCQRSLARRNMLFMSPHTRPSSERMSVELTMMSVLSGWEK
jgi:hypothetical protein